MDENIENKQFLERACCQNLDLASKLREAAQHHIDSFNYIYEEGLLNVCKYLAPIEIVKEQGDDPSQSKQSFLPFQKMKVWFEDF